MFSGKTIFVAPLDWGLGHATRCVPLVKRLLEKNTVLLGTTPLTRKIFDEEFPELEKVEIPPYNIRYSAFLPLGLKLLFDAPRIFNVIGSEKKFLEHLVKEKKIDIVISDNRFGLYSNQTKNIFITHQVFLKTPFANSIAQKIHRKFLLKFDELWIPDYEKESESLSGELSHGNHFHPNVKYIRPLSRLRKKPSEKKYDYLLLLSGPEPQHSILRGLLMQQAKNSIEKRFALVTNVSSYVAPENTDLFCMPSAELLSELIASSETIVCRSGYSTLMDLHVLEKKKLILIPTPGQTEQEYLANSWKTHHGAKVRLRKDGAIVF